MTTPWIYLNGETIAMGDLAGFDKSGLSPSQTHALTFISEWSSGQSSWSLVTSGSTGTPKTIHIRREQLIASARKTIAALNLKPGSNALVCLDTRYIAGMMMLVRSIEAGMNMIIVEPSGNPLHELPSSMMIHFAAMVPYQLGHILREEMERRLDDTAVILGGAPVRESLMMKIQPLKTNAWATFGMTETISHIALQKLTGHDRQQNFHVLPGINISIDDRGCLVIAADYLDETIRTNDVVDLKGNKEFRWLGRWDNIINSGGIKVIPEKIESIVSQWMQAQQMTYRFFVSSLPHPVLGNEVVLMVESENLKAIPNDKDLLKYLKRSLGKYEVPKRIVYQAQFAETATGKIDRKH